MPILRQQDAVQAPQRQHEDQSPMKYELILTVQDPDGRLAELFAIEARKQDRAEIAITKKQKKLILTFSARDAIALKAATHTMIQLLEVDERMEQITNDR